LTIVFLAVSCAPEMRRAFVTLTYHMFECVEKADSMVAVDAFISGCNDFLLSKMLNPGVNVFGAVLPARLRSAHLLGWRILSQEASL
jgi:hypothetical protein